MRYPHLRVTEVSGPVDPFRLETAPGPWRALDALRDALAQAAAAGEKLVVWEGDRVHDWPDLPAAIAEARALGLSSALAGAPDPASLAALDAAGVEIVIAPLHGEAATHDAVCGPGHHARVVALLEAARPRVRVVTCLDRRTPGGVADAVARARDRAETITLVPGADVPPPDDVAQLLDRAWEAARGSDCELHLDGVHVPPDLAPGTPRPLDDNLVRLRLQGGWLPGLHAGVEATGADAATRARCLAAGMPVVGVGPEVPPPAPVGGTVAVVVPELGDGLLACSTLPGLVDALRARGVDVRLTSVWERPWNLHAPEVEPADGWAVRLGADGLGRRRAAAEALDAAFLQRLDLDGVERVIVPGWRAARAVWEHPSLPPDARVQVVDMHLMDGWSSWHAETWGRDWPERVGVTACFPAYASNFERVGVPIEAMDWRPYPLARGHLPTGLVADAPPLAAGHQRRDPALLTAIATARGAATPLDVLGVAPDAAVAGLSPRGTTDLPGLAEAVGRTPVVVLPVAPAAFHAAGITLASLAMAMGRPVVGTRAWGLVDHVRHGEAGWLCAADDPEGMAHAIERVLTDEAWAARLREGASRAGAAADVEAWADDLVAGRRADWPDRRPYGSEA